MRPAAPRVAPDRTRTLVGSDEDEDEPTTSTDGNGLSARPASRQAPPPIPSPRRNQAREPEYTPTPSAGNRRGQVEPEPQRVKLPSQAMRQRPYTRFAWTNLPKVPASEMSLMSRVQGVLPADPHAAAVAVAERVQQLLEHPCVIKLTHVFFTRPAELRKLVPEPSFLAQLALAPHVPRGILDVELALAHALIDQLLGGGAGEAVVLRPLTDIEEGVLSYMMLEGFKALAPSMDPERPKLRVESALRGVDDALAMLDPDDPLVVLQYVFSVGEVASGYFRLFLPSAAVDAVQPSPQSADQKLRRQKLFETHAERLSLVKDTLRAEIAHCELSALDLRGLGPGDVVLVEEPMARPDLGEGGHCKLRVGLGQRGHWKAKLDVGDSGLQATLEEVVLGTELPAPQAPAPAEAQSEDPASEFEELPGGRTTETTLPANPWEANERTNVSSSSGGAESAELLNDIPLHVSVELARVPVTAEEVVALRAGQVVALGRPASSAVELSVNGKIVAQGELVEVDGQLGVKITQLVA